MTAINRNGRRLLAALLLATLPLTVSATTPAQDGMRLAAEGKYAAALKAFHLARPAHLGFEERLAWGKAAAALGHYQLAAVQFEQAGPRFHAGPHGLYPGDAWLMAAEAYLRAGLPERALAALRNARTKPSTLPYVQQLLTGEALLPLGKGAEALTALLQAGEQYRQGIARGGRVVNDGAPLRIVIGTCHAYRGTGRLDEAIGAGKEAVAMAPDSAPAREALGEAYLAAGRLRDAAGLFRGAARLDAGSVTARYNLACALAGLGQREEACAALNHALRLDPAAAAHAADDPQLAPLKGHCL